jgi:hypothetical protein
MIKILVLSLVLSWGVRAALAAEEEEKEHIPPPTVAEPTVIVEPTPGKMGFFIKRTGLDKESGFGKYIIILDANKLSEMKMVLSYPKEAEVKNITPGVESGCKITGAAAEGSLTIDMTCDPPLSGSARVIQWAITPTVQPTDLRVTTCNANNKPDSCWMGK